MRGVPAKLRGKVSGPNYGPELQGATIHKTARILLIAALLIAGAAFVLPSATLAQRAARSMELSRAVRPWEFLSAVGQKAGLLGNESGRIEAWVYPLKLLRD